MDDGVSLSVGQPKTALLSGVLYLVATPIGNLGDMTFRGLWQLKEANVIYAEDTRVISKLMSHYGLRTSLQRLDAATEGKKSRPRIRVSLSKNGFSLGPKMPEMPFSVLKSASGAQV